MLSRGSAIGRLSCELVADVVVNDGGGTVVTGDSGLSSCTFGILKFFRLAMPTVVNPSVCGVGGKVAGGSAGDFFGILASFALPWDDRLSPLRLFARFSSLVNVAPSDLCLMEDCDDGVARPSLVLNVEVALRDGGAPLDRRAMGSVGVLLAAEVFDVELEPAPLGLSFGRRRTTFVAEVGLAVEESIVDVF